MALNAILVANHEAYRKADFLAIAAEIRRFDPQISSHVAFKDEWAPRAMAAQLLRPTLSVMLSSSTRYWRLRGAVAEPKLRGKIASYRLMQAAGLPLPRWTEIAPETRLDPAEWGNWVVLKPNFGYRGRGVTIARTTEVRYRPPESYPAGHQGRHGPMLAQRYIFGEVPMTGFDIRRDARDGSLHIAEATLTSVWNLSGARGDAWRARGLDGYQQFGAIRVVAEAVADATRRLAR